jgi:putative flippase GtrA
MNNLFNRLLKRTTNNTYIQLFRYLFAGLVAFLADLTTLYFLTDFAGVYYLISAAIGFLVGLTITYLFSVFWIFDERRTQNKFLK